MAKEGRDSLFEKLKLVPGFSASDHFVQPNGMQLVAIDENNKQILFLFQATQIIKPFSSLMGIDAERDNSTVFRSSIGGAVAGGIVAGGVGAIIGSNNGKAVEKINKLVLKLTFDDLKEPVRPIYFFESPYQNKGAALWEA